MPRDRLGDVGNTDECGGHVFAPCTPQGSTHPMGLDLDLQVDLLADQEPTRLDRHVPGHPPVLAIDRGLGRRGQHRLPLHVRPPPRNSPERVTGLVMSLIVSSPSSSNHDPPVGRTAVLVNLSTGCCSTSRKSPFLRCWSRLSVWVVMAWVCTSTSTRESSGESPTRIVPVNSVNCPRTFDSMCRATNPTTVWVRSSSYVPAGGIETPRYSRSWIAV